MRARAPPRTVARQCDRGSHRLEFLAQRGHEAAQFPYLAREGSVEPPVERGLAGACHLAVILALIVIGWRHFQDATTGMAAATFYLLLPYTAIYIGQLHHVWPIALIVWAVVAYRVPLRIWDARSLAPLRKCRELRELRAGKE